MTEREPRLLSEPLRAALVEFGSFLQADDLDRGQAVEDADSQRLSALADAVRPLYVEINRVLDDLAARPHPLSGDLERLEGDLNSLAQAAMEAEQELNARRAGVETD